jgi:H+/Cl- antiporter ClcA
VVLGSVVGIPAALIAALFLGLVHELQQLLWHDLPDELGVSSPPWYLVLGLPVAGAAIVLLVRLSLPGDGGEPPSQGLGSGVTPIAHVPGIALAALATLACGAVLGPEAPVVALGGAIALAVTSFAPCDERERQLLALAGSFAAISALFGGPLVGGVLLMESALALGTAVIPTLLPGFAAAAVGYLIFVGLGDRGGLDAPGLAVPDLPAYEGTHLVDLALAVIVGVAAAALR